MLVEKYAPTLADRRKARTALLDAYFRLGRAFGFNRDLGSAEDWFRKMRDLAERWIADEPDNVFARDQLATSHRKIGDCRKLANDDLAARPEYARAIELGRELISVEPKNSDIKVHLALALDDQAVTLRRLGLLDEAAPLERQAEQHFTELVATDPEDIDNRMRLLRTQYQRGSLEMDELQMEAARTHLRQALDPTTFTSLAAPSRGAPGGSTSSQRLPSQRPSRSCASGSRTEPSRS